MQHSSNFFKNLVYNVSNDINVCMIARVTDVNKVKSTISAKLLHSSKIKNENVELPILASVPLMQFMTSDYIIKLPVDIDDLVLILFVDFDIENLKISTQQTTQNVNAIHDLNNAIALPFAFNNLNADLGINNNDDVLIAKKDNSVKIKIDSSNNIILDTDSNIYLGESATEGVPFGNALKTWLDNHVHTASGAGVPASSSPSPSTTTFVK